MRGTAAVRASEYVGIASLCRMWFSVTVWWGKVSQCMVHAMAAVEFASRSGQEHAGMLTLVCAYNLDEKIYFTTTHRELAVPCRVKAIV